MNLKHGTWTADVLHLPEMCERVNGMNLFCNFPRLPVESRTAIQLVCHTGRVLLIKYSLIYK